MTGDEAGRPVTAAFCAAVEDTLAGLLRTRQDVLLLPGEAVLGLEAAARGIGGPGRRVLNIVTGPYGALLGTWLGAGGAQVTSLPAPAGRAVSVAAVQAALRVPGGYDAVVVVHAEAATGVVNPLGHIAALGREAGALLVVDAVASVGAEPLLIDEWGLDLVILGPQKALGGPSGVSAAVVSARGWDSLAANPAAPRDSILSLLDWRDRWLRPGRGAMPTTPHHLETRALAAALDRLADGGLAAAVRRHRRARDATRAGLRALGISPYVAADDEAASVATVAVLPPAAAARGGPARLLSAAAAGSGAAGADDSWLIAGPAFGSLADQAIRLNHTGPGAALAPVLATLAHLGYALQEADQDADVGAALAAAAARWHAHG
jgi:aspartate aminotransferase-like enzyme